MWDIYLYTFLSASGFCHDSLEMQTEILEHYAKLGEVSNFPQFTMNDQEIQINHNKAVTV